MIRCTARLAVLAAALGLAAAGCSSGTAGQGAGPAGSGTPVATESDGPTETATPTGSTGPSDSHGGGGGGGGGGGSSSGTATRSTGSSPAGDPDARAELVSFQPESGPNCAGSSGTSTVRMGWQTKGANEVWISIAQVAIAAGDPKTTPGATGPLPVNGAKTLPFDCANPESYYVIGVYNTRNGTHSGEILQVQRNS